MSDVTGQFPAQRPTPTGRRVRGGSARLNLLSFGLGTLILLIALYLFIQRPALFNRGREFTTVFRSAAGLNLGDEVRFGGLLVGTVTAMDLDHVDPTRIRVTFRVQRKTPVRTDTRAEVAQLGMLGEPYLNLQPGRPDAPEMPPGKEIPSRENYSFQEAMTQLAQFFEQTDTLFGEVERLTSQNPLQRVDRTLTRLEALVDNTATQSKAVMTQLDLAGHQLNSVLQRSERIVAMVDSTLRVAGPGLTVAQREMLATLQETRAMLTEVRDAMHQGGGLDQLMRNAAVATENLARLTTRLERDPTSVLARRKAPTKPAGPAVRD